jgi:Tfp pilus assembly protein PilV
MKKQSPNQTGFSYVDVLIAVAILLVGVMALVSAITYAVVGTTRNQLQLVAKQHASSTIESIFAARDVTRLQYDSIGNIGSVDIPGGIFPVGPQNIYDGAGQDGIVGTPDDQAGADGTLNTPDDAPLVPDFQREITIANVPDPDRPGSNTMRQIDVTIDYTVGNRQTRETFSTYIANYAR